MVRMIFKKILSENLPKQGNYSYIKDLHWLQGQIGDEKKRVKAQHLYLQKWS